MKDCYRVTIEYFNAEGELIETTIRHGGPDDGTTHANALGQVVGGCVCAAVDWPDWLQEVKAEICFSIAAYSGDGLTTEPD